MNQINQNSRKRSAAWNYFTVSKENPRKAKCLYCERVMAFNHGGTNNLMRHVKARHPDELNMSVKLSYELEAKQIEMDVQLEDHPPPICSIKTQESPTTSYEIKEKTPQCDERENNTNLKLLAKLSSKKQKRSEIWRHYSDMSRENESVMRARCMYCGGLVSYTGGSIGNLKRHIKMKHPSVFNKIQYSLYKSTESQLEFNQNPLSESETEASKSEADDPDDDKSLLTRLPPSKRKRSDIWLHYSEADAKKGSSMRAKCIHCDGYVSYYGGSTGNLLRHISKKHPMLKSDRTGCDYLFNSSIPRFSLSHKDLPSNGDPTELVFHDGSVQADGPVHADDGTVQADGTVEYTYEPVDHHDFDGTKESIGFSNKEERILLILAKKYIEQIESKRIDAQSIRSKQMAWSKIECEFNELNDEEFRDKNVLIKKYEIMKIRIKEKYETLAKHPDVDHPLNELNNVEKDVIKIMQSSDAYENVTEFTTDGIVGPNSDVEMFYEESVCSSCVSETEYELDQTQINRVPEELERIESSKNDPIRTTNPTNVSTSSIKNVDQTESIRLQTKKFCKRNSEMEQCSRAKAKYIQAQHRCFVIAHSQQMKFKAAEHDEKIKMLQLQQEFIRKQIEVENLKL